MKWFGRMTREKAEELREQREIVQIVVHEVILPDLVDWVEARGWFLQQMPLDDENDLPTFIFAPKHLPPRG